MHPTFRKRGRPFDGINYGRLRSVRGPKVPKVFVIDNKRNDDVLEEVKGYHQFSGGDSAASLTAVATLVGASPTKDILTTASTLVQSTSVSAQKNYYQKQTGYAILNVMDSDRAKKWSAIYDDLTKLDIDKYSLSAALSDLVDYRRQGRRLQF